MKLVISTFVEWANVIVIELRVSHPSLITLKTEHDTTILKISYRWPNSVVYLGPLYRSTQYLHKLLHSFIRWKIAIEKEIKVWTSLIYPLDNNSEESTFVEFASTIFDFRSAKSWRDAYVDQSNSVLPKSSSSRMCLPAYPGESTNSSASATLI